MSITKELAARIRATRDRLQLTQEDVAAHLGVPRSAVSDIESGKRELSAVELVALARLFGESLEDLAGFTNESPEPELVMLRAAEVTSAVRRQLNQWIHMCETYAELEGWLDERREHDLRPGSRILSTYEDARNLAGDERKRLGLGMTAGHELLNTLEERLGVKVLFLTLEDSISGASVVSERFGAAILVNRAHTPGRRTFTLAHEFFHLLTRGRIAGAGRHQSLNLCESPAPGAKKDRAEQLADQFAAQLLMPPDHFAERLKQVRRADGTIEWMDMVGLAQYFGVSVRAVFVEMAIQKFVSWDVANQAYDDPELQNHIGQVQTGSRSEPTRFRRLAAKAYRDERISRARLADLLEVSIADVGDELRLLGAEDGGDGFKVSLPR